MAKIDKHLWNIETSDGKHEIRVKMRSSSREPIDILVDGQHIDTVQFSGSGMIPNMEYDFPCGNEIVKFVLHGSEIDMVHRGVLVRNKTAYKPQEKLPMAYRVIVLLLTCSAFAVIPLFYQMLSSGILAISLGLLVASIASCLLISSAAMTSPFKSKGKKIFISLFMIVWAWLLAVLVAIFL